MQEAAFEAAGIKAFYLALELEPRDFKKVMRGISRLVLDGFNVTVPHKLSVMPYLDAVLPEARAVGAVNTVFRSGRRWIGANTDVYGFLHALKTEGKFQPQGKKILVLGAGGAARAVIYGLAKSRAQKIFVVNRAEHSESRKRLVDDFEELFPKVQFDHCSFRDQKKLKEALKVADLVVQATSVGTKHPIRKLIVDNFIPIARSGKRILFFDLIYHTSNTPFLKSAKKKGHRTMDGRGMLLFQGAKAFELWTGKKAPVAVMHRALLAGLKECS